MINIQCNKSFSEEKEYIFSVIFTEFLGLDYNLNFNDNITGFKLLLNNESKLAFSSSFWDTIEANYLVLSSMPSVVYCKNDFIEEIDIPILYGSEQLEIRDDIIDCGIDIFAGCFFMLSRMEEAIIKTKDQHGRFQAISSVAYNNNFLDRPVVDEYVEMLWNMLRHLDPAIKRKERIAANFITCDVDWPQDFTRTSIRDTFRKSVGDVVKRKNFFTALARWKRYIFHKLSIEQSDYFYETVFWMMEENEKVGNNIAFYFITDYTGEQDSLTDFDTPAMRILLKEIHDRGHEIGLHPGYNCFNDPSNFKRAVENLKSILQAANINQQKLGGRMHYLRWDHTQTPQLWDNNGMDYDSTLGFADKPGFRCGTCHEFPIFDLTKRQCLKLRERPLITMESTIIEAKYENLSYSEESYQKFQFYRNTCHKYGGTYTLLWHNSFFETDKDKEFYLGLIRPT